jgi:hypothetical protein
MMAQPLGARVSILRSLAVLCGAFLTACASVPAPEPIATPVAAAQAQPVAIQDYAKIPLARFRACLAMEDGTKERLDCYDGIVPPEPKAAHARAKIISECRFIREEDGRLQCFNSFLVERPRVATSPPPPPVVRHTAPTVRYVRKGRGGCGSRGGAGYRLPSGKCASRRR